MDFVLLIDIEISFKAIPGMGGWEPMNFCHVLSRISVEFTI